MSENTIAGKPGENKQTISDETILKISKEIAVKFIEMGRITPSTFEDSFSTIHRTIQKSAEKNG